MSTQEVRHEAEAEQTPAIDRGEKEVTDKNAYREDDHVEISD